jgi:hypothetical protein
MKYFVGVLLCFFTFSGCNDGDLITSEINLDTLTTVQKCTDSSTLYKINGQEALLLNIAETFFPNIETPASIPTVVNIGSGATAVYRKYSGTPITTTICANPAPATPIVTEEWNIVGGTIEITTVKIPDTTTPTTIVGYNHNIVLKNVTFVSPSGQQITYTTKEFGNYRTNIITLPFNFATTTTVKCLTKNLLFRYDNSEVLILDVDPALFLNDPTVVGTPRQRLVNSVTNTITNKVIYRKYNGGLNADFFCGSLTPATPFLIEEWNAVNGVATTSGIITVDTEALNSTTFRHTIKLFKTSFKNGIREYSPNPNGSYLFGTYTTTL